MAKLKILSKVLAFCRAGEQPSKADYSKRPQDGHGSVTTIPDENFPIQVQSKWRATISRLIAKGKVIKRLRRPTTSQRLKIQGRDVQEFKELILAQRSANALQHQISLKLDGFDAKVDYCRSKIQNLGQRMEKVAETKKSGYEARLANFREAIQVVEDASNDLQQQRALIYEELVEARAQGPRVPLELLEMIEGILVQNKILLPYEMNLTTSEETSEHPAKAENELAHKSTGRHQTTDLQGPALRRSPGSQNLRRITRSLQTMEAACKEDNDFVLGPKDQAEWEYRARKMFLGQWEKEFEEREDKFDQEHYELMRGRVTGTRNTTVSQLDRRQILETRRLAQALTKAEDEFYVAKEAAVVAGVDLGSEAESGFASRSDDGYLLSLEADGETDVDRERIMKWLESLPEVGLGDVERAEAIDREAAALDDERFNHDDDSFDLDSVDLCDTRSAVAEGPWRRRIDKWNSMKPQACGAEIGDARAAE